MEYDIETRLASKNSWFTPDEARNYYGKYDRDGITVHWWGGGQGADAHDGIVDYFLVQGEQGVKSVNYVLSDGKITLMVSPENAAFTSQSGNATTVSIETQPTLTDEGYKKWGWSVVGLEDFFGRGLQLYPHSYWWGTECPGTISLDRIRQEADKWRRGEYNAQPVPQPTPTPTPPPVSAVTWKKWDEGTIKYVVNKDTNLWRFDSPTFDMTSIKPLKRGELFVVYGHGHNTKLDRDYYVTEYSFNKKIPNGVNPVDLDLYVEPTRVPPSPPVDPVPTPEPQGPEWVKRLRDIDDTKFWFTKEQPLIDITTGKPYVGKDGKSTVFEKDDEFTCSALTVVGNVEYRITDYSFKKGIFNGVPISSLTLTPPGVPNIPPVPSTPDTATEISWIRKAIQAILDFFKIKF